MTSSNLRRLAIAAVSCLAASLAIPAHAAASLLGPPPSAEPFVQACAAHLDLTEAQRTGLRAYLEQEIEFMAVQAANHSAAAVAELIPGEREQLQRVAGRLMSPGQLRQFRELEATPQMKAYLKQMLLEN